MNFIEYKKGSCGKSETTFYMENQFEDGIYLLVKQTDIPAIITDIKTIVEKHTDALDVEDWLVKLFTKYDLLEK